MQIENVPIATLSLDPSNARKHSQKNLDAIKGSLQKFKQVKPIVVRNNVVIAGNGTLTAAKDIGWTSIDIVRVDHMTATEATAYALSDNRTAEIAEWDQEILGKQLQALYEDDFGIEDFGFEPEDFDIDVGGASSGGLTDEDEVPEVEENVFGVKRGDIWQLGEHRLMCGDSTSKEDVDRLMAGEKADMVFTDPPYGGNVGGLKSYTGDERLRRIKEGKNLVFQDKILENDKDINWLEKVFPILPIDDEGTKIVFFKWDAYEKIKRFAGCWGNPSALIVWDRVKRANNFFRFQPQHELAFHWGNQSDKREKSSLSNVFSIEKDEKDIHPTVKPIALIEPMISVCSSKKEKILDPFLGSGSTLIACEKTNRKCYGMEIDPHYCSVIIKRWQDFTGKQAVKISEN